MARQTTPPGLRAAAVTSIPPEWSASWFRGFITNYLQPADIRNTTAGLGITISPGAGGNVASPGTVSVSTAVQALFSEPYILAVAPTDTFLNDYRVVAGESGVITVTDSGAKAALTVGVATNGIGNAQIRQSAAASIIGNATNATGNVADIVASADGQVLQRLSGTLSFVNPTANPTAKVGLTVVNGSATTFMRSDAAPPIDPTISPTWTGSHTFGKAVTVTPTVAATALSVNSFAGQAGIGVFAAAGQLANITCAASGASEASYAFSTPTIASQFAFNNTGSTDAYGIPTGAVGIGVAQAAPITFSTSAAVRMTIGASGGVTIAQGLGVNGNAAPAQTTGFGTPTAASLVANFPGTGATLAQCGGMISELTLILKSYGFIGA